MRGVWNRLCSVLVLVGLAITAGCASMHEVQRLDAMTTAGAGRHDVLYSLPRAVVLVDLEVAKVGEREPAACDGLTKEQLVALFSGRALPITANDVLQARMRQKSVSVTARSLTLRAEPDPQQQFAIEMRSRASQERILSLVLSPDGLLSSATSEATSLVPSIMSSVLGTAGKLGGRLVAGGAAQPESTAVPVDIPPSCVAATEELEQATSRLAELLAPRPGELSGVSLEALNSARAAAAKQVDALAIPFLGLSKRLTGNVRCEWIPGDAPPTTDISVVSLTDDGVVDPTEGARCWIPRELATSSTRAVATVSLRLNSLQSLASAIASTPSDNARSSFHYRVPGRARITLLEGSSSDQATTLMRDVLIPQFGMVRALPAKSLAVSAKLDLKLDPATGALVQLGASSKPVDAARLTSDIGAAAGELIAARQTRDKAEAEATDELRRLERERKILEERAKIRELREQEGSAD